MRKILYTGLDPSHYNDSDATIIHLPLIQIVPRSSTDPFIQAALHKFSSYTHIIITSKSSVSILKEYLPLFNYTLQDWKKKLTLSVGKVTTSHLETIGIVPQIIAQEETAEGITTELAKLNLKDALFFWPRSSQARPVLEQFFNKNQLRLVKCDLYDTIPTLLQEKPDLDQFDEIVFTSPSTVKAFLAIFDKLPSNKILTPIGPITEAYLKNHL